MFFAILFRKLANNFFTFKIANNIYLRNSAFNFFNQQNFFRPIWNIAFCKNVLYFDILTISPVLNLDPLSLISLPESINVLDFTTAGFILVQIYHLIYQCIHFLIFKSNFFKILMNNSNKSSYRFPTITYIHSLCVGYISITFFSHDFINLL